MALLALVNPGSEEDYREQLRGLMWVAAQWEQEITAFLYSTAGPDLVPIEEFAHRGREDELVAP